MNSLLEPLAKGLGADVGQIKIILCLLLAYPLGSLFIRIPSHQQWKKHLFSVVVTFVNLVVISNIYAGYLQLLGDILLTYFVAKYVKSPHMPWIVFVLVMAHLTYNHVTVKSAFGVTGPQMVLVMKLTTFAWNVLDGRTKAELLDKWQTEKRVVQYPSLIEFLGYSYYFPGFLVGPYIDYAAYTSLINESLFKEAEERGDLKEKRKVPLGRKRVAYTKGAVGLGFLLFYVLYGGKFSYANALEPWFVEKSLLYRIIFFIPCGFLERSKYYAIWTLTEAASILTGYGFSGYNSRGKSQWKAAANVDYLHIEFAPNFKVLLDSWNMKTNIWLRECVYKRVTPRGKKPGFSSSMITFVTSAFWHGIAPGYYVTFLLGGFLSTSSRLMRNNVRPFLLPGPKAPPPYVKAVYDGLGILFTVLATNFLTIPFILLSFNDSLTAFKNLGFYGLFIIFTPMLVMYSGGAAYSKKQQIRLGIKPPAKKVVKVQEPRIEKGAGKLGLSAIQRHSDDEGWNRNDAVTPGTPYYMPPLDKAGRELEKILTEDATIVAKGSE